MGITQEAQAELEWRAAKVGADLQAKGWRLATAESCTGGWISQTMTAVAGSSSWFDCGFVTYSNISKTRMLGVSERTLEARGAVSEATVLEMARGALSRSGAQVAVAVSGIAGPDGGSADKPVGTVWIAWVWPTGEAARRFHFEGDRAAVRAQTVAAAFDRILTIDA